MNENLREDIKFIGILAAIFFLYLNLFWCAQGSVLYDLGRELYLPSQIIKGEVLYKDIFNIYGPFSYMINALYYKFLGEHIASAAFGGTLASFIILICAYLIGSQFVNKILAFWISLYLMVLCIFSPNAFNFILPYSYAMTYALCNFLLSVLFLIKYVKSDDQKFAYLSAFFAGTCLISKYEYFFLPIVLAGVFIFIKPLKKWQFLYALLSLVATPVIFFSILFAQGLEFSHLTKTLEIIQRMSQTKTLHFFYSRIGVYFGLPLLLTSLMNLIHTLLISAFLFGAYVLASKSKWGGLKYIVLTIASWIVILLTLSLINYRHLFSFLPLLLTILALINIKRLWQNKLLLVLVVCSILSTSKTFFFIGVDVYGTYIVPLILIGFISLFIALIPENKKELFTSYLCYVFLTLIILTTMKNLYLATNNTAAVTTAKGTILTLPEFAEPMNKVIEYIQKNTAKDDTVLIFPETPLINFLTDRPSDSRINSLIPLYVETFGEQNIIQYLEMKKPEYIVVNRRITSDYGQNFFCEDYALMVCDYIKGKYSMELKIDGLYGHTVYKLEGIK